MIDIIISVLIGLFLCWFVRAAYIHILDMEYVYHLDEYSAKEQEDLSAEVDSPNLDRKIDEMEI